MFKQAADSHHLPVALVLAICRSESGLDPWACRHEPGYRWLWDVQRQKPFLRDPREECDQRIPPGFAAAPGISVASEWFAQQTSWGLMQIMGAQAREYGFKGHLPRLCDPETGLLFGCRHLARARDRWFSRHGWAGVVAAYNAGAPRLTATGMFRNQAYVDRVLAHGLDGQKA